MREPGPMNHSETGVHGPGSACYPSPSRMTAERVQHPPIPARIQISNSHAGSPVLFEAPGAPSVLSLANKARGVARRAALPVTKYALFLGKSAAPTGAPPEDFSSGLFAAFSFRRRAPLSHRSSREPRGQPAPGRGPSVSPGGAPTPPGAQGRRSLETQAPHLAPSTDVTG